MNPHEPDRLEPLEELEYRDLTPALRVIRGDRDYSHRYTIRDGEEDAKISLSRHEISQIAELAGLDLAEPPKPGDDRARVDAHRRRIHAENELRETELDAIRALEEIEDALASDEGPEELRKRLTEIRSTWVEARLTDLYEGYEEELTDRDRRQKAEDRRTLDRLGIGDVEHVDPRGDREGLLADTLADLTVTMRGEADEIEAIIGEDVGLEAETEFRDVIEGLRYAVENAEDALRGHEEEP